MLASPTYSQPVDPEPPTQWMSLSERPQDSTAIFAQYLTELIGLTDGGQPPPSAPEREWFHLARSTIADQVRERAQPEWFEPLMRAMVYDFDLSFVRDLVEPAMEAYGRREVKKALIEYLATGTTPERTGAGQAWYFTQLQITFRDDSDTPTTESVAIARSYEDVDWEWSATALRVFVEDEDVYLRRCVLPWVPRNPAKCPEDVGDLIAQANDIVRTHSDDYIRRRGRG